MAAMSEPSSSASFAGTVCLGADGPSRRGARAGRRPIGLPRRQNRRRSAQTRRPRPRAAAWAGARAARRPGSSRSAGAPGADSARRRPRLPRVLGDLRAGVRGPGHHEEQIRQSIDVGQEHRGDRLHAEPDDPALRATADGPRQPGAGSLAAAGVRRPSQDEVPQRGAAPHRACRSTARAASRPRPRAWPSGPGAQSDAADRPGAPRARTDRAESGRAWPRGRRRRPGRAQAPATPRVRRPRRRPRRADRIWRRACRQTSPSRRRPQSWCTASWRLQVAP